MCWVTQTNTWKYFLQKFHPLGIILEKQGEKRGISEEGQGNIHKFGLNPKINLTGRFLGRNGKGKRKYMQKRSFLSLQGLENKCSIMIYLTLGFFLTVEIFWAPGWPKVLFVHFETYKTQLSQKEKDILVSLHHRSHQHKPGNKTGLLFPGG